MINQPAGHDVLAIARRTLLDTLVPALPADKTYDALMIANAMAIAMRELQQVGRDPESRLIHDFLHRSGLPEPAPGVDAEAHLAHLVRERALPEAAQADLQQLLLALTRNKLSLSNPKYLNAA